MNRSIFLLVALLLSFGESALAVDFTHLGAVKRLREEKRYDEAIQKLEAMAAKTNDAEENYLYLDLALDVAVKSLKSEDRSLALAAQVKEPSHHDFATLRVLSAFRRYDDALASVRGKNIDAWPVRCRGHAHAILAEIHHAKKDDDAELQQWQLAANSPAVELGVRGRALREAGMLHLKRGDAAKAEERFRQTIGLTSANYAWRIESLVTLSRLLIENRRAKEAVSLFDGIDFAKIGNAASKGNLLEAYARALLAAGKKIRAIETFDRLLQTDIPAAWKDRINKELDRMAEEF